jgi:hypothetical protein
MEIEKTKENRNKESQRQLSQERAKSRFSSNR